MSRCPANDRLERFLAQQLDPSDQAFVAGHVRDCPECRVVCARLAAILDSDTVTLAGPPPLPPDPRISQTAPADAPTVRLWRHQLGLRTGERLIQAGSVFDLGLASWPSAQNTPTIPGYEVLGELGRGGMGVVFKARQVRLNRLVALKMIHTEELSDPDTLGRFRTEAEAVARLQHPNIVQIYEVGEASGRPFFSLEYVGGGSLAQHAAGRPQPPIEAAGIVEVLARAVHYAHSQGVIHRDLKPGNVLLQTADGGSQTDADRSAVSNLKSAVPKVADFGLAKYPAAAPAQVDSPSRRGLVIGTPQYMAPESYSNPTAVGPATDVYALGAILYELLTGRAPFKGTNAVDTLLQVRLIEPIPPRVWQPKTPRDLETIALKCLQKEPKLRYPSARDLADDLRRFQDRLPIRARPASLTERAWKAGRRHPVVAALGLAVAAAAMVTFATITWRWRHAEAGRAVAESERAATATTLASVEWRLYRSQIARIHDQVRAGRFAPAADLLRQCQPSVGRPDLRGWEWHYLQRFCTIGRDPMSVLPGKPNGIVVSGFRGVSTTAVSPDGRRSATIGADGLLVIADAATGQELLKLQLPAVPAETARPLVAFSDDGLRLVATTSSSVSVWECGAGPIAPIQSTWP